MKNFFNTRRIWVTGASSGIGYACVLEFIKQGARSIVISGRNMDKLYELKAKATDVNLIILPFDVTSREQTLQAANQVKTELGGIDVVFLNAGASEHFDIQFFDSAIFERMIHHILTKTIVLHQGWMIWMEATYNILCNV